ncbi:hypothetical protein QFZ23_002344 [Arthrobacter globiformis]|nr:hypothetical protein [Arthrobacter globiformis]
MTAPTVEAAIHELMDLAWLRPAHDLLGADDPKSFFTPPE